MFLEGLPAYTALVLAARVREAVLHRLPLVMLEARVHLRVPQARVPQDGDFIQLLHQRLGGHQRRAGVSSPRGRIYC